jgi:hypothetical protein
MPMAEPAAPCRRAAHASSTGLSRGGVIQPAARSNVSIGGRIGATAPVYEEAERSARRRSRRADADHDLSFGRRRADAELAALAAGQAGCAEEGAAMGDPFPRASPAMMYDDRPPRRQPWPVGAWIAVVGAASFGVALAVMVGIKMFQGDPAPVAQTQETPEPETPDVTPIATVTPTPTTPEVEPETPEPETPQPANTGTGGNRTKRPATPTPTKAPSDGLTPEQRRLMEQFGRLDRPIGSAASGFLVKRTSARAAQRSTKRHPHGGHPQPPPAPVLLRIAIRGRSIPPSASTSRWPSAARAPSPRLRGRQRLCGPSAASSATSAAGAPAPEQPTETGPVVFQPGASN